MAFGLIKNINIYNKEGNINNDLRDVPFRRHSCSHINNRNAYYNRDQLLFEIVMLLEKG
jgi:hypothetical protein